MQDSLAQLLQPLLAFCFSLQPMTVVPSRTARYAVIGCKLKQNANEGCNSCATVVQVLQDLFYVLLHVLFYLWSLLKIERWRRKKNWGKGAEWGGMWGRGVPAPQWEWGLWIIFGFLTSKWRVSCIPGEFFYRFSKPVLHAQVHNGIFCVPKLKRYCCLRTRRDRWRHRQKEGKREIKI